MDEKKKTCMDSGGPGLMTDGELGMFPGNSDLNDRDYCDYHKKKIRCGCKNFCRLWKFVILISPPHRLSATSAGA